MLELTKRCCSRWHGTIAVIQPWIFFTGKDTAVPIFFLFLEVLLFLSVWMLIYCIVSQKHVHKAVRMSWLCSQFRRPKGCGSQRWPGARFAVECWGTCEPVFRTGPPVSGEALGLCLNEKRKRKWIACLLQSIWGCMRLLKCLWELGLCV